MPDSPSSYPAQNQAEGKVDQIRNRRPQGQNPQVDFGIAEDPTKEKDRSADMPQEQADLPPVESQIGEGVGHRVFLARHVL